MKESSTPGDQALPQGVTDEYIISVTVGKREPLNDMIYLAPALVVSPDSFNNLNEDLILAAVTSQVTTSPHSVPVAPTDCQDGSLPKESFVKLTKVFTISSALILKSICRLRAEKLGEVLAKLRELYS